MAGKASHLEEFSIEQLQAAIQEKKRLRIDELRAKRSEVVAELRKIEAEIASATGQATRGRRAGRGGGPSMATLVLKALASSDSKEVQMSDLIDQLKGNTSSDKPGVIISQALIRLKKDGLVESAGRGLYKLTASGKKKANEG